MLKDHERSEFENGDGNISYHQYSKIFGIIKLLILKINNLNFKILI